MLVAPKSYFFIEKDSTIICVSPVSYMLAVVRSNKTVLVQLQVRNWCLDVEIVAFQILTLKLVSVNKAEHKATQSSCVNVMSCFAKNGLFTTVTVNWSLIQHLYPQMIHVGMTYWHNDVCGQMYPLQRRSDNADFQTSLVFFLFFFLRHQLVHLCRKKF